MNRQVLIFIFLLLVIVGIGTYVMLFRIFPPPTQGTTEKTNGTALMMEPEGNLSRLHTASLLSPTLLADGATIRTYEAASGHVRDIDVTGNNPIATASNTAIVNLQNIWWSSDNKVVITLREDVSGPQWLLYDYIAQVGQPLDPATTDVAFSPDSQRFAYALGNGTESVLYTASVKGNGVERIATVPEPNPLLWWISPETILVAQRPTGLAPSSIWSISLKTNTTTTLRSSLQGFDVLPSPDGSRLLQSGVFDSNQPMTLQTATPTLTDSNNLPASTLIQKCVWIDDNTTIICALPAVLRSSIARPLPDAYHWGEVRTEDTFMVINTSSARAVKEIDPEFPVDATNLIIPPTRDQIVFINRHDGLLYRLRVPEGF